MRESKQARYRQAGRPRQRTMPSLARRLTEWAPMGPSWPQVDTTTLASRTAVQRGWVVVAGGQRARKG